MISGFVDTNLLIDLYRGNPLAKSWFPSQPDLAVCSMVWFEFVKDTRSKAGQQRCLEILSPMDIVFVAEADQRWAMQQILRFQSSHGVSFTDCLIAAVTW